LPLARPDPSGVLILPDLRLIEGNRAPLRRVQILTMGRVNDVAVTKAIAVAAVVATFGLAACGGGSSGGVAAGQVLVGRAEPLKAGSLTASQVAADDTAFGFALFQKLCAAQPSRNLTLSPASAAEALGMLDAGSAGATRAAVGRLLHLPAWNSQLVAALHQQSAALAQVSQVTVSNHIFEQTGVAPTQQALDDLKTAYDADLRQVNYSDEPATTNAINAVISHDTDALIPTLFGSPLDATTQTVLANAVLLDAKWRDPFPSSQPGVFTTASGGHVTAPLMQNTEGEFASRTSGGWQSVVLPYQGDLQAVAILPPTAAGQCATPSASTLDALVTGTSASVGVVLPKLNLAQTLPLTQTLASMGLPLSGDYSGLGRRDDQISEVVQKVVMKVDQSGTKAAAATGIGIATLARVGGQTVTFDRPFLLVLEDTATRTPLFLARVADPTTS
jgi:serpin B